MSLVKHAQYKKHELSNRSENFWKLVALLFLWKYSITLIKVKILACIQKILLNELWLKTNKSKEKSKFILNSAKANVKNNKNFTIVNRNIFFINYKELQSQLGLIYPDLIAEYKRVRKEE